MEGWGGSWGTRPGGKTLHTWTTTGMVPFVAGCQKHSSALRAAFARQVCQSRILSWSGLIWAPSGRGGRSYLGAAPWNHFLVKKKSMEMKLWRSSLVWVCSCPALTSPIPSNWNYSVPLLQGRWTSTPKYSMASHWQCPRSCFSSGWKSWNRHLLLSLCHSCDYRMQPKRLLGSQVLSGSSPGHWDRAGRERFAQPRIPSWECPEVPLRTQNSTGEAHGTSGI